jgi:DNA repair protein RecO (recombination protein O)
MAYFEKSTGIILKKIKGKDNDQILVVFTEEFGKLYIIAKGAQKVSGRRVGSLDSLNIIRFSYSENNDFYYLKEVDLISSLQLLKNN